MDEHGLQTLLLTAPADIFYLTGFLTRFWESPARPWFVILPRAGEAVAVIPEIGVDLMSRCAVEVIRSWPAPDPVDDGVSLLAGTLCDLTPPGGAIGTPMGLETHMRMPLADLEKLRGMLFARRLTDATAAVQRVREIKSEPEIAKIRAACAIADRAFARVPQIVDASAQLAEVFRRFQMALLEEGADWVSYTAGGAGQGGYGDVISPVEPVPLRRGDVLMLDTGAVKDGYFCDFDRNFSIGAPSDAVRRGHAALHAATDAVLGQLRPGMLASDAHGLIVEALAREGMRCAGGRQGHGLGVTLTEWPSFTALDSTPLRAGMVLTIEPGVALGDGKILVAEENIVLREEGPELLSTRAPAEIQVIAR